MKREGRRGFGDNLSGAGSTGREDGAVVLWNNERCQSKPSPRRAAPMSVFHAPAHCASHSERGVEGPIDCPCGRGRPRPSGRADPRFATGVWFRLRRVEEVAGAVGPFDPGSSSTAPALAPEPPRRRLPSLKPLRLAGTRSRHAGTTPFPAPTTSAPASPPGKAMTRRPMTERPMTERPCLATRFGAR